MNVAIVMIPLLPVVLFFSSTVKHSGAEARTTVTFTPNWSNIFIYESVTLACNAGSTVHENQTHYWYRDKRMISIHQQRFTIQSASDGDRGDYQCRTRASQKSDPVGLRVFNTMLILQRPPMLYEGDPLTLRCHSFPGYNATNTTFYRNKTVVQFSVNDTELHFTKVDLNETGTYRCTKQIYHRGKYQTYSAETLVSVQGRALVTYGLPWILVGVVLIIILCAALLFCKYRHRLLGRYRQQPITVPDTQPREEDDVNYTYIDMDYLRRVSLTPQTGNSDYSVIYSFVTQAVAIEATNRSSTPEFEII